MPLADVEKLVDRRRRRIFSDSERSRPASTCELTPVTPSRLRGTISVDDIRIEKARFLTEYLSCDEGKHLLHQNKEMAGSVSKLDSK